MEGGEYLWGVHGPTVNNKDQQWKRSDNFWKSWKFRRKNKKTQDFFFLSHGFSPFAVGRLFRFASNPDLFAARPPFLSFVATLAFRLSSAFEYLSISFSNNFSSICSSIVSPQRFVTLSILMNRRFWNVSLWSNPSKRLSHRFLVCDADHISFLSCSSCSSSSMHEQLIIGG